MTKTKAHTAMQRAVRMSVLFLLVVHALPAAGQQLMPVLTPEDGLFLYHDKQPRLGSGFHVHRTVDGVERQLTESPFFPAASGADLQGMIGGLYEQLAADLESDSPQEIFLTLRGNRSLSMILSLTFPEIAQALGYLYIDPDPVTGRRVTYRFEWVNSRGIPIGEVFSSQIVVDAEPPVLPQPASIQGERTGNRVLVSWQYPESREAGEQVVRFEVFMRQPGTESFRKINERSVIRQTGLTRFEYGFRLDPGIREADFVIVAFDHTGRNQRASEPVRLELTDMTVPASVNQVFAVPDGPNTVRITWPVGTESILAGYHVDRLDPDTGERLRLTSQLIDLMNPVFVDEAAVGGRTFYYYIIAVSQTGVESEDGNPAIQYVEAIRPPSPPANLRAEVMVDQGVVRLDWDSSEKDELFQTYVVLRREHTEERNRAFSQVNRVRITGNSHIDRGIAEIGLTEGVYYEYAVTAANVHGLRSDTIFAVMQMPDITPPDPPSAFRAEIDRGTRINVTWGASPSPDVVRYNIYKTASGQDTVMISVPRSRRFVVDETVVPGEIYRYFATAVDSAGNESTPSREVDIMMRDFTPPPSVRNLQAVQTDEGVHLRWETSSAGDILGYLVFRSDLMNGQYVVLTDDPVTDVNWIDSDGQAGKWYQVLAVDGSGNQSRPGSPRQAVRSNTTRTE